MVKPLEGVRILSIEQYGAGPFATLHLADLGAEVIKIEDPSTGGEVSRSVVPYAENGDSLFFQTFNRNKKSITLNLKSPEGIEMFRELAKHADAVFNNLRGDVPEKLGVTYQALKDVNSKIVACSLSGFGTSGSMKADPAYDYLLQAMLGHMSLTGEPGGPPTKYGISIIDFSTGMMAALALMIGIFQSRIHGIGSDVDISMFDTAAWELTYLATWHLTKGYEPPRTSYSAHPALVPSQLFPTKDGHLIVMCNKEKFYPILCELLGAPELAEDERFKDFTSRYQNKEQLIPKLIALFQKEDTATWLERLRGKVPIAPVNSVEQALQEPLIKERDMIVEVEHPYFGELRMLGQPIKVSTFQPQYQAGPALGAHNEEIYGKLLQLTSSDLACLREKGIV